MADPNLFALVTGANRGLGKETVRQLARRGVTVLLGCRSLDRGREAAAELAHDGVFTTPIELDVADCDSVHAAAKRIGDECGRLDVLVNNAGIHVGVTGVSTTADHMRQTFEVNVFGVVTVIHALLPLLRRSPAPRVVNVSSTTASLTLSGDGIDLPGDADRRLAYASSKAALNMLTIQYARTFDRDPDLAHIRINAVSPGYTATDMNDHRGSKTVAEGARAIVDTALLHDGRTGVFLDDGGTLPW